MEKFKKLLILLIFTATTSNNFGINIREAIKQKKIKVDVRWKSPEGAEQLSSMHGENMQVKIQNISAQNLKIEIPTGFMFTPIDESKQNMIITQDMNYDLKPNEQKTTYTHGYCCEASDGGPSEGEIYAIKKSAMPNLVKLAEFLRDSNFNGYGVQRAIWAISNNKDIWNINMDNQTKTNALITKVGKIKGLPESEITAAIAKNKKAAENRNGNTFEKYIDIQLDIANETEVWIVIQDINNNTLRYVAQKIKLDVGVFKKGIGVSSIDFGAGTFYVRVYSKKGFMTEKKFTLDM